jgi:tetratricopeptide (TPR) repeat protein
MSDLHRLLQHAGELARNDHVEEAHSLCDQLISRFPDQPEGYAKRAYINAREAHYDAAIADIDAAIRLAQVEPEYWYARGRYSSAVRKFEEAEKNFANVLAFSKTAYYVEPAHFFRAYALIQLGRFKDALLALDNVSDSFETWVDGRMSKADLMAACQRSPN